MANPHAQLFWWERTTLPASEVAPGLLPQQHLTLLTLTCFLPLGLVLAWAFHNPFASLLALPFARLIALDLTTYTLPDVYTFPLLAAGIPHALAIGLPGNILLAATTLVAGYVFARLKPNAGIGGGDIKLLAALYLWLSPVNAAFSIALGCLLWLPVAFVFPRRAQPFGVPLILGWLLFSAFFMARGL